MSKTKYWLKSIVFDVVAFAIAAWWLVLGSVPAENIFTFWNWVFSILGFLTLAIKTPRPVRPTGYAWYHGITEAITISILVSQGHTFGAIFRLAAALLMEAARDAYKAKSAPAEGGAK